MCLLLVAVGVILFLIGCFKQHGYITLIGTSIFFTATIIGMTDSEQVEPMDVYQGKTTLEITYKDGVAIDSVVVFKNKK